MTSLFSRRTAILGCTITAVLSMARAAYAEPQTEYAEPQTATANALSLPRALALTEQYNPQLLAYPFYLRAADGQRLQAEVGPQTRFNVELENVLGTGDRSGLDQAELTLALSQTFELGGKRDNRLAFAHAKRQQLALEYELSRLDTLAETSRRYYALLALQAQEQQLSQRIKREQKALTQIRQRGRAGAVAAADVAKMALRLAKSEAQQQSLERQLSDGRLRLAAMWLGDDGFSLVKGQLANLPALPTEQALNSRIQQALAQLPQQRYQLALTRLADADVRLQQANGRSDITLGAGVRHFEATSDQAFIVNASLPLAFSNPNRGRIASAQARQQLSLAQAENKQRQLELELQRLARSLNHYQQQLARLNNTLLPAAQQLLSSSRQAYIQGRYSVLQWIDAQQQQFQLQQQRISTQLNIVNTLLELERILGSAIANPINATASAERI